MNITEQANKFAEETMVKAMNKVIADAYTEGYMAGYKACEEKTPLEVRGEIEFVDLGLPSGTLWASDYLQEEGKRIYIPYCKACSLNLPTEEQWNELRNECRWEYDIDGSYDFCRCRCVGPNGQVLTFERTGRKITSGVSSEWEAFFWIQDGSDTNEKDAVHMYNHGKNDKYKAGRSIKSKNFTGYQLPVRLVK